MYFMTIYSPRQQYDQFEFYLSSQLTIYVPNSWDQTAKADSDWFIIMVGADGLLLSLDAIFTAIHACFMTLQSFSFRESPFPSHLTSRTDPQWARGWSIGSWSEYSFSHLWQWQVAVLAILVTGKADFIA